MDELYLDDIQELALMVMEDLACNDDVAIYATSNNVSALIKSFFAIDDSFMIGTMDIESEYGECLIEIDPVYYAINVCNASKKSVYEETDANVVYIEGSINSNVINSIDESREIYIFDFGEEPCCDNELFTEISRDQKGNITGYTQSGKDGNIYWSRSYYSTDENSVIKELNEPKININEIFLAWKKIGELLDFIDNSSDKC